MALHVQIIYSGCSHYGHLFVESFQNNNGLITLRFVITFLFQIQLCRSSLVLGADSIRKLSDAKQWTKQGPGLQFCNALEQKPIAALRSCHMIHNSLFSQQDADVFENTATFLRF